MTEQAGGKSTVSGMGRATMNGVAVPLGTMRPLAAAPKAEPVRPIGKHFAEFAFHYLTGRHRPGNLAGEMGTGALIAVFWNAGNDLQGRNPEEKHATACAMLGADSRLVHDTDADAWSVKQA